MKFSDKIKIWPGNKNVSSAGKNCLVNDKAKKSDCKVRLSGFVQIKHKTTEARVNHQETGVSKFAAGAILASINMQHKVISLF